MVRVLLLVGLLLLWVLGLIGLAGSLIGDCGDASAECAQYHDRTAEVVAVGLGILVLNTAVALVALFWRSRAIALTVVVVAGITAVIGAVPYVVDGPPPHPIGNGFLLFVLGAAFLIGAAVIELADEQEA